jgi:hypothetical protein
VATKQAWASGLFVAGVVIAMTAIIAAATKYLGPWTAPWFFGCLVVAFGLLVGSGTFLVSGRRSKPLLVFGEFMPSSSCFVEEPGQPLAHFLRVEIENKPKCKTAYEDARNVSARLTFKSESFNGTIYGRWSHLPVPVNWSATHVASLIDIPVGTPYILDIACQMDAESDLYAYNDVSVLEGQTKYPLGASQAVVTIEVRSPNAGLTNAKYLLKAGDVGHPPHIERVVAPKKWYGRSSDGQ